MDRSRWERIQNLFHAAVDLPHDEKDEFLKSACSDDASLIADVSALLYEDSHTSRLDEGLSQVARDVITPESNDSVTVQPMGPYQVQKVLGEGGMGVVYLAERKDLKNLVAIKVLRDAWLSPARRERFRAEQRMLAQLNHPSIARIYDADTLQDGTPFFVMEYVEGLPLTEYCRVHRCSMQRRLELFRQVCEAVRYAHSNAVIHRDIKPSNILVRADATVHLLDFGIAKQMESVDLSATQPTVTALRWMTPAYASPEQLRGQQLGVQTDVYSLGVILYEVLTGQFPFHLTKLAPAEIEAVLLNRNPDKPSAVVQSSSIGSETKSVLGKVSSWGDLDVLCLTAMHKDVNRRYGSAEALIRDIDHYLANEPLEARPDQFGYRLGKFVRRNRRDVIAGAVAAVLVAGLTTFFTLRITKARDQALAEAARTERVQSFVMRLFQGGDDSVGPASDMKVITLVDRGTQEAHTLDADPRIQIQLYQTLGGIYEGLGKFDQAQQLFQASLEKSQATFGKDSVEAADTLVAMGGLRSDKADYPGAEKLIRQALEIDRRKLPGKHPAIAKAMAALGATLTNRGDYDQAIQIMNEAARLQVASGASQPDQALNLTELANAYFYRGNYELSDSINRQVLGIDRQLYGNHHPNVGEDLINLGALQFQWGHYPEAENYQRQALDIMETYFGKDHQETASVMTALGRALIPQGKLDEAGQLLQQALAVYQRVYGAVHPRVAATLGELGKVEQQQGKFDQAEADFHRMLEVYKEIYRGKHYYIGSAISNLGGVAMERKQFSHAEQLFREALRMYAVTLPPDHQLIGIVHVRLGRALLRQRRFEEAEFESRQGYDLLVKQLDGSSSWLQNARTDRAEEYESLHQPDKAAKFRSESIAIIQASGATSKN